MFESSSKFVRPVTLAAVLASGFMGGPANADCAGSNAIDECLVGAWKQTGGGAVEWMRRNMPPGMSIPHVSQGGQLVVLNRDGSFWSAPASGNITIRMEGADGVMQAQGDIKAQASGTWSAANGEFHLCTRHQKFEGQAQATFPGGGSHAMPLNPPPSSGPTGFGYKCSGDALETVQAIPGVSDPMTTQYKRTDVK